MSNPIKVCLVGAGRAAKVHANSLANYLSQASIVAVVDPVPEVMQALPRSLVSATPFPAWFKPSKRSSSTL